MFNKQAQIDKLRGEVTRLEDRVVWGDCDIRWALRRLRDSIEQLSNQLDIQAERERALLDYLDLDIEVDTEKLVVRKRDKAGGE